MSENDYLEHYGVPGMRWGVRKNRMHPSGNSVKKSNKNSNSSKAKKSNFKRNLVIGTAVATAALATYGVYRYGKFIRDENVKIAIENGKKFADNMKMSDIAAAKKYPDAFKLQPDSNYEKYIKEYADKARKQKFSEAYKNVKQVSAKAKREAKYKKAVLDEGKKIRKQLKTGKVDLGTMTSLTRLAQFNPDVLKSVGISIIDRQIYLDGKKML